MNAENSSILPLEQLMKSQALSGQFLLERMKVLEQAGWTDWFFGEMTRESSTNPDESYPSQGLVRTQHDGRQFRGLEVVDFYKENTDFVNSVVTPGIVHFLSLANHPERMQNLVNTSTFEAPKRQFNLRFWLASLLSEAISINEVGLAVEGANHEDPRSSRTKYYHLGPFQMIGRYPRSLLVGSANPEVWGSAPALAHMA